MPATRKTVHPDFRGWQDSRRDKARLLDQGDKLREAAFAFGKSTCSMPIFCVIH